MLPMVYMALIESENDKAIFNKVYKTYHTKLFALAHSILKAKSLAEDAVSESFLKLAKNFQKVNKFEVSQIAAYTVIIVKNQCYDMLKSEEDNLSYSEEISNSDADRIIEEEANKRDLYWAINSLPDIYKDAIILRYYFNLSISDVSDQLGISYSGAKKRIAIALKMLRKEMAENE